MNLEDVRELMPYLLGLATTIIALKKDWISSQFTKEKSKVQLAADAEDVEFKALQNVEKQMSIYQKLLDDAEARFISTITRMQEEITDLNELIVEQKLFIAKQQRSLKYYEDKFGKLKD